MIRMIHKSNLDNSIATLKDKNHSDYSRVRQARLDGEYSKRIQIDNDLK